MRHDRNVPAQRLIDLHLPRRIGEMIVAANDMGDAHVVIVDHHGQHIGWVAVRAQQYEIVELLIGEGHFALHLVVDDRLAFLFGAQADHRLDAGRRLARIAVAPAPVIAHRPAGEPRLVAHRLQFVLARIAIIGAPGRDEALGDLAMARRARELAHRLAVPVEAEPG
jgi:hypothetical protein